MKRCREVALFGTYPNSPIYPKKENDTVFAGVSNSQYCNNIIADWVKSAGITKDITFHCFRHTFATLQLTNGTDLYTVSKMLGHADVKTTQIYAQIGREK